MLSKIILILVLFILVIGCCVQGFMGPFYMVSVIRKPPAPKPSNVMLGLGSGQECVHANTAYGKRIPGDWKAYSEIHRKPNIFFRKTSVDVKYPSNDSKESCSITFVNVENLYRECKCYQETVEILEGGVGKEFTTLRLTTEINCPNEHRVAVYTKC